MKPHYTHKSLKLLKALEPLNSKPLVDRIYDEILVGGQSFTPATAEAHHPAVELLGELMNVHAEFTAEAGQLQDMFGEYLEGSMQTNQENGQFFTPMNVVRMIVQMTLSDSKEELLERPLWICDPACGTGRFMLGVAEHFNRVLSGYFNFCIVNVDVDRRAAIYCTMNAILNQIPSITIWGNALSLEIYDAFAVLPGHPWPWIRVDKDRARGLLTSALEASKKQTEGIEQQAVPEPMLKAVQPKKLVQMTFGEAGA